MLRRSGDERQERDDHQSAADPEQPRGCARQKAEGNERGVESNPAHFRNNRIETAAANSPNTTFSGRSPMRARRPTPTRAPTIEPSVSAIAYPTRTSPAAP